MGFCVNVLFLLMCKMIKVVCKCVVLVNYFVYSYNDLGCWVDVVNEEFLLFCGFVCFLDKVGSNILMMVFLLGLLLVIILFLWFLMVV